MEFIGLLGLIGLVGFFSSRGLEQNFNKIERSVRNATDNASGVSSRLDSNEKKIETVDAELRKINYALRNCATAEELNRISQRLNELQRTVDKISSDKMNHQTTALSSKLDELNEKISEIQRQANSDARKFQEEQENLRGSFDKNTRAVEDIERRVKALELRPIPAQIPPSIPTPPPVPVDNSSRIAEERFKAVDAKIFEQSQTLLQHKNFFGQTQNQFNALQKKIDEQQKLIGDQQRLLSDQQKILEAQKKLFETQQDLLAKYDERIKILERDKKKPTEPKKPVEPPPPTIRDFNIKKMGTPLFTNDPAALPKALETIENLSGITTFLENSRFEKKDSFIRQMEIYRKNLNKFTDKVQRGKFDEENFSEEATEAFLDVLSKYFFAVLPVAIYRGGKDDPRFYSDFLKKINEYLSACHVYTNLVEPKKIMTTNQLEFMTVVKKDTAVRGNDKIIDEVERLPYFIDYLTENGELEKIYSEGKMIVFKFSGDKK